MRKVEANAREIVWATANNVNAFMGPHKMRASYGRGLFGKSHNRLLASSMELRAQNLALFAVELSRTQAKIPGEANRLNLQTTRYEPRQG